MVATKCHVVISSYVAGSIYYSIYLFQCLMETLGFGQILVCYDRSREPVFLPLVAVFLTVAFRLDFTNIRTL